MSDARPQPPFAFFPGAQNFHIGQQTNILVTGNYISGGAEDLIRRLNPLWSATHTRNRKTSPPDSECFPGTRGKPILEITSWADQVPSGEGGAEGPHIYWLYGFAGCGKSAISLKVSYIYAGVGRLLASYFFFRGAGDRSTMKGFAATLASQLLGAIPAAAPFIGNAIARHPWLLTDASLTMQLEELVFNPILAALQDDCAKNALTGPLIIVIDGLDECDDRSGVEELVDCLLNFFEEHPTIPLRVLIASRVEQHIRERLETDGVRLSNLDHHWPKEDIETYLRASFDAEVKRNRIIKTHIRTHGPWPTQSEMEELVDHVKESFVLASTTLKYIVTSDGSGSTPMKRLPLTLRMNGLDDLYASTLTRSQDLHHFREIISTIALLREPLPIIGISELLGIEAVEVVSVLLNLQAIIHVPGADDEGQVSLCHTSLRDFLTTEARSRTFFVPSSFHLYLAYYCFSCAIGKNRGPVYAYARNSLITHWKECTLSLKPDLFFHALEQVEASQLLNPTRLPCCTFITSCFFYSILWDLPFREDPEFVYPLTECTRQAALVAESPDPRIGVWLGTRLNALYYVIDRGVYPGLGGDELAVMDDHLQRAEVAIRSRFPEILREDSALDVDLTESEYRCYPEHLSGIGILKTLRWIVGRARFVWEETKAPPALHVHGNYTGMILTFDSPPRKDEGEDECSDDEEDDKDDDYYDDEDDDDDDEYYEDEDDEA